MWTCPRRRNKRAACCPTHYAVITRRHGSVRVYRFWVAVRPWEVLVPRGARGQGCVCVAGGRWPLGGVDPNKAAVVPTPGQDEPTRQTSAGHFFRHQRLEANAPHATTTVFQLGQCNVCTYTVQHAQPTQPSQSGPTQPNMTRRSSQRPSSELAGTVESPQLSNGY